MGNDGHVRSAQATKGSVALKKCGESPEQIARRTGAKLSVVGNWLGGHRRPGTAWRDRLSDLYQIDPDWWSIPIEFQPAGVKAGLLEALTQAAPPSPAESVPAPAPELTAEPDSDDEARALINHIRRTRAAVEVDPMVTLSEKVKILDGCSRSLERVYRLTGEASDLSVAKIMKSPRWQQIMVAIDTALAPYEEAGKAVVKALISLAQDS